jgi:hypothetical protein
MSLFAGLYARHPGTALDAADVQTITRSIARLDDPIETYQDERFFIAKFDFAAFGEPAFLTGNHVASATGEPYLRPRSGRVNSRSEDLAKISQALASGRLEILGDCQGSFSLCQYLPSDGTLRLVTDRLGVRPVYYHTGPEFIYFSSNLRVLEGLAGVPKRLDLRGVAELAVFGYPLADRTPYADIKTLREGHLLECRAGDVHISQYFNWSDIRPTELTRDQMIDAVYETFLAALECRSARDSVATSFLSGGMDSRVVVAGLTALGKDVCTITFETAGRKDAVIARQVAKRLGTHHTTRIVDPSVPQHDSKATAVGKVDYPATLRPRYPSLIFSGDGGSVGLGFVYMSDRIVELCRGGARDELLQAVERSKGRVPRRLFHDAVLQQIEAVVSVGVSEEMEWSNTGDPAKDYHRFLMNNDQRRHLASKYEDLDRHQSEFLLPFHDGRFQELIASAPVDWFLLHRFYNDWMFKFPKPATSVAWQVYPGHAPCPIAEDEALSYRSQWQPTSRESFARAKPAFHESVRAFVGAGHPTGIIRRSPVAGAMLLHGLRIRNYQYVWNAYSTFARHWKMAGGAVVEWRPEGASTPLASRPSPR